MHGSRKHGAEASAGVSPTASVEPEATLTIHTAREIGLVSPRLFGHFLEHFPGQVYGGVLDPGSPYADETGLRTDVVRALKRLEPPVIRWPGGCYASGYHWRWGAGPAAERRSRPSTCWRFHDTHRFGTTEFAELCSRVGAEPYVCVGVGPGERHPTPDEAAAWVRYCNAETGPEAETRKRAGFPASLDATLWGLGNEVYAGIYDRPEDYGRDLLEFARAMRAADPRIRFVIVGAEQHWLEDWNAPLLTDDDVIRTADWISWHDYLHTGMCEGRPNGSGLRKPYEAVMEHLLEVEARLEALCRLNREASIRAGREDVLELAVDEWNELGWELFENVQRNDLPETYSLAHALYTAGFLNVLIRRADGVTMANYSPTVNTRGLIFAGPRGIILRTTYHVYRLLRACAGGRSVRVKATSARLTCSRAPVLDAAAVKSGRGGLTVVVVNRHPEAPTRCRVSIDGMPAFRGTAKILTGDSLASFNSYDCPDDVTPREGSPVSSRGVFDYVCVSGEYERCRYEAERGRLARCRGAFERRSRDMTPETRSHSSRERACIATVGSIVMDLAVTTPRVPRTGENILARAFRKGPGGKGANAAAAAARLGADSHLVGSVGDDDFGREELGLLREAGVDTGGVSIRKDVSTGVAVILVDDNGENTILVALGANAALTPENVDLSLGGLWGRLDAVLVNFEVPEPVVFRVVTEAKERDVPVVLDAGPPRHYRRETWSGATIVSPNRLETEYLVGRPVETETELVAAAKEILAAGPEAVVIKRGAHGALACTREGAASVPAFDAEVVDTTGAGDAFTAALTVGVAEGMNLEEAVRFGCAAGAVAVSRFGTMPAMPTRSEVELFLDRRGTG